MSVACRIQVIGPEALLEKVQELRNESYRLVQIGAVRLPDQVEITYSFDWLGELANLRVLLPGAEPRLPSISSVFPCAFLYENEIHDLFNVRVDGMAVDFKGNLYKTAVMFPFGTVKAPASKPASPPAVKTAPQNPDLTPGK